jgi:hypothetical protein
MRNISAPHRSHTTASSFGPFERLGVDVPDDLELVERPFLEPSAAEGFERACGPEETVWFGSDMWEGL